MKFIAFSSALVSGVAAFTPNVMQLTKTSLHATSEASELFQRELLAARLSMGKAPVAPVVEDVGPKPAERVPIVLPERDLIKEELTARSLLETRLEMEAVARANAPVPDVGPKPPQSVPLVLPERDLIKEELTARSLLEARLEIEAIARANAPVPDVGPKPPQRVPLVLPERDLIKEELTARSLLSTRLEMEAAAAEKVLQEALAEQKRQKAEQSRVQEARQRGLLKHRLAWQAAYWEVTKAQMEAEEAIRLARQQPKAPEVEAELSSKYGSIDCIEEKAFTILADLGMVETV